jgi:hypothetical protein
MSYTIITEPRPAHTIYSPYYIYAATCLQYSGAASLLVLLLRLGIILIIITINLHPYLHVTIRAL